MGDDNTIVFATDDPDTGLWRVSADGGEASVLTKPNTTQRESDHVFPSVLPNARAVLFTITEAGESANVQLAALDLKTGQRKALVPGATQAEYVGRSARFAQSGFLTYVSAGALRAMRFDPVGLAMLSDAVTIEEDVMLEAERRRQLRRVAAGDPRLCAAGCGRDGDAQTVARVG